MGRSSCGLAAAARHAAAAAKDEGAQKELMSAVVDEARRQALAVDTVMADVMRAKGKSVLDSTDDPQEQVCDAPCCLLSGLGPHTAQCKACSVSTAYAVAVSAATLQMVEADAVDLTSQSFQSKQGWGTVQREVMKPSTAKLMTGLLSVGLKSLEAVDHETCSTGGEWAAEQAFAEICEKNSR
jgi:hypothetical protein